MNEIKIFENPEFGSVRVVERDSEPWFVARDIAERLGYKDTVNAIKSHVDDEDKAGWQITTQFGKKEAVIINESGLYSLVLSSKLPGAKRFKRWVVGEVLPSIRRTGGYLAAGEDDTPEEIMARALLIANDKINQLKAKIEQDREKVAFAESVSAADGAIHVGTLAKLCCQNGVKIGQQRLFNWLRQNKYLMHINGVGNIPTQRSIEMGILVIKETTHMSADGHFTIRRTPMVTGKGQVYFVNKLCGDGQVRF